MRVLDDLELSSSTKSRNWIPLSPATILRCFSLSRAQPMQEDDGSGSSSALIFLGRGYRGPQLTNNRFVPNSLDKTVNNRLYKTGDLVRRVENNDLDYLGRLDNQI